METFFCIYFLMVVQKYVIFVPIHLNVKSQFLFLFFFFSMLLKFSIEQLSILIHQIIHLAHEQYKKKTLFTYDDYYNFTKYYSFIFYITIELIEQGAFE